MTAANILLAVAAWFAVSFLAGLIFVRFLPPSGDQDDR